MLLPGFISLRRFILRLRAVRLPAAGILALGCCLFGVPSSLWGTADGRASVESPTLPVARVLDPEASPQWLWRLSLGHGYSTPAVRGERVFAAFHREGREGVAAFELSTGKRLWQQSWTESFEGGGYGPGPNAPLVWIGDRLLVTGVALKIALILPEDGTVIWRRDLVHEEGATIPGHGYAAAPFRHRGNPARTTSSLLYGLGGKSPGPVIALDAASGEALWKRGKLHVGYATPGRFRPSPGGGIEGLPEAGPASDAAEHAVFYTRRGTVGIDPLSGREIWRMPHPPSAAGEPIETWNASLTPLQIGPDLIFTATRSDTHNGSRALRVANQRGTFEVEEVWFEPALSIEPMNHIARSENGIYATTGGGRSAALTEIEGRSGRVLRRLPRLGDASLVRVGSTLLALSERGMLTAVGTERELSELWRFDTESRRTWSLPLLIDDLVVIRGRERLGVIDLTPEQVDTPHPQSR